MKIFLLGLPGSGKTTLGHELAQKLVLPLIDLDAIIENDANHSIPEIFKQYGEDHFRMLEKKALQDSFNLKEGIISTGGGAPCFFDNMELMNNNGTTIFIDVSSNELIRRMIGNSQEDRPLLAGKSENELKIELDEKRSTRLPFYNQADYSITGDNIQVQQLLDALKQ